MEWVSEHSNDATLVDLVEFSTRFVIPNSIYTICHLNEKEGKHPRARYKYEDMKESVYNENDKEERNSIHHT